MVNSNCCLIIAFRPYPEGRGLRLQRISRHSQTIYFQTVSRGKRIATAHVSRRIQTVSPFRPYPEGRGLRQIVQICSKVILVLFQTVSRGKRIATWFSYSWSVQLSAFRPYPEGRGLRHFLLLIVVILFRLSDRIQREEDCDKREAVEVEYFSPLSDRIQREEDCDKT